MARPGDGEPLAAFLARTKLLLGVETIVVRLGGSDRTMEEVEAEEAAFAGALGPAWKQKSFEQIPSLRELAVERRHTCRVPLLFGPLQEGHVQHQRRTWEFVARGDIPIVVREAAWLHYRAPRRLDVCQRARLTRESTGGVWRAEAPEWHIVSSRPGTLPPPESGD